MNEEVVNTTENEESGAVIIRIKNTTNMKAIKVSDMSIGVLYRQKQLSKGGHYQTIDEVEAEVLSVVQTYHKKKLIEYALLVDL